MNSKQKITKYTTRNCYAKADFNDDSTLLIMPRREWGHIKAFEFALLYQRDSLESVIMQDIGPTPEGKTHFWSFWSKGKITQRDLGNYMESARQYEKQFSEDYKNGKINEKRLFEVPEDIAEIAWMVIHFLKHPTWNMKILDKNPGFKEKLELKD